MRVSSLPLYFDLRLSEMILSGTTVKPNHFSLYFALSLSSLQVFGEKIHTRCPVLWREEQAYRFPRSRYSLDLTAEERGRGDGWGFQPRVWPHNLWMGRGGGGWQGMILAKPRPIVQLSARSRSRRLCVCLCRFSSVRELACSVTNQDARPTLTAWDLLELRTGQF